MRWNAMFITAVCVMFLIEEELGLGTKKCFVCNNG